MRLAILALALAGCLAAAAPAAAAPRVAAKPKAVDADAAQVVKGRGWPVNEFCRRRARISLRSDQNAVRLGAARVRRSGRFRFEWVPADANIGPGRWRLVARMRCESGKDGSPVVVRASVRIRVRA